jgi:hypothetical protein
MTILVGGPLNGVECLVGGFEIVAPIVTIDYTKKRKEWFDMYGEAYHMCLAFDIEYTGPQPPSFPIAVYEFRHPLREYAYFKEIRK